MVHGCIRKLKKDSKDFPIDNSTNWYIILTIKDGKIIQQYYTGRKSDKMNLLKKLNTLNKENTYFKLYGIWPGQWNTHVFDLDVDIILDKLEKLLDINKPKKPNNESESQVPMQSNLNTSQPDSDHL